MKDLEVRAKRAIENGDPFVYDLMDEHCQIFGNVRHMHWVLIAVMHELTKDIKKWSHLEQEVSKL